MSKSIDDKYLILFLLQLGLHLTSIINQLVRGIAYDQKRKLNLFDLRC